MIYYRNEEKIRKVPEFIPYVMPVAILAMLVFFIMALYKRSFVFLCVVIGLALFGTFCDYFFDWFVNARYECGKNLVFKYNLVGGFSDKPVVVKIERVKEYRINGKSVTMYGVFTKKSPMKKEQTLGKIKLPINFADEERTKIIELLENEVKKVAG